VTETFGISRDELADRLDVEFAYEL
jgi:hypothetical protein